MHKIKTDGCLSRISPTLNTNCAAPVSSIDLFFLETGRKIARMNTSLLDGAIRKQVILTCKSFHEVQKRRIDNLLNPIHFRHPLWYSNDVNVCGFGQE